MPRPRLRGRTDGSVAIDHPFLGALELLAGAGPDGVAPTALFCENETNNQRLFGVPGPTPYPKDGINDHVGWGGDRHPDRHGTKAALWYRLLVGPAATVELRLRLRPDGAEPAARRRSAPASTGPWPSAARRPTRSTPADPAGPPGRRGGGDAAGVRRDALEQAAVRLRRGPLAGGRPDPADPTGVPQWRAQRPLDQLRGVRRHVDAGQVEYPWFAAWDLAFHCVALAHLDPAFAKYQLLLLCREWFQHPSGALPAYEWDFGTSTPGLAALEVFAIDGVRPRLPQPGVRQAAGELHLVGEPRGRQRLEPVRRRLPGAGQHRPARPVPSPGRHARAVRRHRVDGLLFALHGRHRLDPEPSGRRPTLDLVLKFLEHFAQIRHARPPGSGTIADGFYYDKLVALDGSAVPVKVRSMVGVIPLLAAVVVDEDAIDRAEAVGKAFARLLDELGGPGAWPRAWSAASPAIGGCSSAWSGSTTSPSCSPSCSTSASSCRRTARGPCPPSIATIPTSSRSTASASIDYEPAESTTGMFGGTPTGAGPSGSRSTTC